MGTTILIADDHKIMRDGLRSLLERRSDFKVLGEAENGRRIVAMVREVAADVVIMDVGMPDLNGIDAARQIKSIAPDIKIVALSMYSDNRSVSEMFKAGASAYLLKDCAFDELSLAVQVVMKDQVYLSPQIAGPLIKDYLDHLRTDAVSPFTLLTLREREVLQLLGEGMSARSISSRLNIGVKTVETHRQQLMKKLNLENLAGVIKYAIREGFTSLDDPRGQLRKDRD